MKLIKKKEFYDFLDRPKKRRVGKLGYVDWDQYMSHKIKNKSKHEWSFQEESKQYRIEYCNICGKNRKLKYNSISGRWTVVRD